MAPKPGLMRAIPMALLGFIIAVFLVAGIRALQELTPVLDTGVALVVAPFFMMGFFLWGLGGFDPRMSEHNVHEPEGGLVTALVRPEDIPAPHHDDTPAKPITILGFEIWKILTLTLLLVIVTFAFALLPGGFTIRSVGQAEASMTEFAQNTTFDLPVGLGSFQGSQLAVFLGFILFTVLSLFLVGGALGGLMFLLSRNVAVARSTVPSERDLTPPLPARAAGRVAGGLARGLRRGLPNFFGQK